MGLDWIIIAMPKSGYEELYEELKQKLNNEENDGESEEESVEDTNEELDGDTDEESGNYKKFKSITISPFQTINCPKVGDSEDTKCIF